jgi:hypothetical protein
VATPTNEGPVLKNAGKKLDLLRTALYFWFQCTPTSLSLLLSAMGYTCKTYSTWWGWEGWKKGKSNSSVNEVNWEVGHFGKGKIYICSKC